MTQIGKWPGGTVGRGTLPKFNAANTDRVAGLAAIQAARMSDADKAMLRERFEAGDATARFVVAALVRKQQSSPVGQAQ